MIREGRLQRNDLTATIGGTMPARPVWTRGIVAAVALFCAAAFAASVRAQEIAYDLNFGAPNTHLVEITMHVPGLSGATADFSIPAWSPGWYVINDYAKFVQEFSAQSEDGRDLAWRKTDKQTWRVQLNGARAAAIRYKVYGNTPGVDSMQYNDQHAELPGPTIWMYLVNGKDRAARLTVHVPNGWKIATGMAKAGDGVYTAPNYDTFIDTPIELSDFVEKTFDLDGTTYHLIVHDMMGKKDFSEFAAMLPKVVKEEVKIFAPVAGTPSQPAPFADYYFLVHLIPGAGGGLEHLNSAQIFLEEPWDAQSYASALALSSTELEGYFFAHEFFHAWNDKRLRPIELGPFDYTREVNTYELWEAEGVTDYYAPLNVERAGVITPAQYWNWMGRQITQFEGSAGRKERTLEQTSWDTWFWYTGPGRFETNEPNTDFSYYTGGQVIGQLLDLAIRNATKNQKSLDDWMRLMYQRYALPKPGFTPEDAVKAASEVAGTDMSDFFRRYVSGKEVPDYAKFFEYAGISVTNGTNPQAGWFGVSTDGTPDGKARINYLWPGGPAEKAGLDRGDVLEKLNGAPVNLQNYRQALSQSKPGDTVTFTVLHFGAEKEMKVTAISSPHVTYQLKPMENPTELQKQIYNGILGIK
jgi:predicted metalloprotease with PDZ domain